MLFKTKKDRLLSMFERMRNYRDYQCDQLGDLTQDPLAARISNDCDIDKDRLLHSQTPEEVEDLREQFHVYYSDDIPSMRIREKIVAYHQTEKSSSNMEDDNEEALIDRFRQELDIKAKPLVKSDYYSVCKQAHLEGLVRKFGLKPDKFGENLLESYQKHEIDLYPMLPLETCQEFVCKLFPTAEAVLQAAKMMHARQLSLDPTVRSVIRRDFFANCLINVRPTREGTQTITEEHPCFPMKYVLEKPIRTFCREEFLHLIEARKNGLIRLEYLIEPKSSNNNYLEEIKRSYSRDEYSENVLQWNKVRAECVELMFNKFLFPKFQNELEEILLEEAKLNILRSCAKTLAEWIKVAPYRVSDDENVTSVSDVGVELVSIAYATDHEEVSFAVALDANGKLLSHIRLPNLMIRNRGSKESQSKRDEDFRALENFFDQYKPKVVCLSVENRDALFLRNQIENMLKDLQENGTSFENSSEPIKVVLVDPAISKVYALSKKAESEFREHPPALRQAISQGRRLQDPLLEIAQLFNYDKEILLLKYHPLQDLLDRDRLLAVLEQTFISRTNEVGVDLNRCLKYPHTSDVLQFVCGLGPRKAASLIKFFKKEELQLENRTQLVLTYKMGKNVYANCVGFIKINTDMMADSQAYIEILDSTRIHPEAYDWARKMAVDALDSEDAPDLEPTTALKNIFEDSERLKDLDLDAFAVELRNTSYGDQSITLYDIRAELTHRYKDLRVRYELPSDVEIFAMVTKETTQTFYVGKLIQCQVFDLIRKAPTEEQIERHGKPEKDEATGAIECPICLTERFRSLEEVKFTRE